MENVLDIITQASIDLKDPKFGHFSKAMLRGWASEGQREIARRTDCLQKQTGDIASLMVADTIEQSLATIIPNTEVIGLFNVYAGTSTSKKALAFTTIPVLDRDNMYWRGRTSGTPTKVYVGPGQTLGFADAPPSATWLSANGVWIIYSCLPLVDFTSDSQVPEISRKAWDYIVDYCVLKGKREDREFTAFDRTFMMWKDGLAFIKSEPRIDVKGRTSRIIPPGGVGLHRP